MSYNPEVFFPASVSIGAILAGFCGTFLSFRIQREAGYYRSGNLSHFTASLMLLMLATLCTAVFGIVFPLFALIGGQWISPRLIVGGIVGGLLLLAAYFVTELFHYDVFKCHLRDDLAEWKTELPLLAIGVISAAICFWYFADLPLLAIGVIVLAFFFWYFVGLKSVSRSKNAIFMDPNLYHVRVAIAAKRTIIIEQNEGNSSHRIVIDPSQATTLLKSLAEASRKIDNLVEDDGL